MTPPPPAAAAGAVNERGGRMKSVLERAYLRPLQRSLTAAYTQSLAAGFRTGPTPRTHPRFADGLRLALLSNAIMRCRVPSGTRGTRGASLSCMRGLSVRASALLLKLVCLSVCLSHSSSNGERVLVARHRSPPPNMVAEYTWVDKIFRVSVTSHC